MATQPTKKRTISKTPARKASSQKVDFEPNKMTLAISALSVVLLLLLAIIVTQG